MSSAAARPPQGSHARQGWAVTPSHCPLTLPMWMRPPDWTEQGSSGHEAQGREGMEIHWKVCGNRGACMAQVGLEELWAST